jgi:hypothetical protein
LDFHGLLPIQSILGEIDEEIVESLLKAVFLFLGAVSCDASRDLRHLQHRRQIEFSRFPVLNRPSRIELIHTSHHLVHSPETELRH